MASASIFLSLPAACSVQGPYPHMYGVWLSCLGGSTHTVLLRRVESKALRLINSSLLTDGLDYLSHQRNVASLSLFYRNFYADCSSELANCMPPPFPRPRCTRLSIFSHPYSVHFSNARVNQYLHSFISYTVKLWNSLTLSVFPPVYDLNSFQKRSVKTPLMLTETPLLAFISPTVLFTGSGDKRDFFNVFVSPWPVPF